MTSLEAFFDRQRELLAKERQAEIDQTSLLLSNCSPKLLEKKGLALLNLGVVNVNIGLGGKSLVELERPAAHHTSPLLPPHSFRPGDLARIDEAVSNNSSSQSRSKAKATASASSSQQKTSAGVDGVVYKVSSTKIIIAVDTSKGGSSDELDLPERIWVIKIANTVTYDRMDQAVDRMSKILLGTDQSVAPNALQRVLFGLSAPSPPEDISEIQWFNESGLNPSQRRAVKLALASPEIALIHGPPGTGKTHTLIEVILQLASRQKKILVCGASNLAVDNILERLMPHKVPVIRIGHPARVLAELQDATLDAQAERSDEAQLANDVKKEIETLLKTLAGGEKGKKPRGAERRKMYEEVKELRKEYRKREGTVVSRVVNNAQIVLCTCHGAGGRQLFNRAFDVVIIDEAAQALEAVCWIPILKTSKLILAGDPLQLPPTVISSNEKGKKSKTNDVVQKKIVSKPATQKPSGKSTPSSKGPSKSPSKATENDSIPPKAGSETDSDEDEAYDSKIGQKDFKKGVLISPKSLEVTLFDRMERMWGNEIKQMLDVQYRMNTSICDFPSTTLYSGKLSSDESVASRLLTKYNHSSSAADTLSHPVVFFDTAGSEYFERVDGDGANTNSDEGSKCNVNEVEIVKKWVEELIGYGVPPNEIAIITPYQAQLTLLVASLIPLFPGLEIGTVDGMQGREKDAVIISLVRSNDKRQVGFLKEKRRMNVAMTRPRMHLCVVGDSSTIRHGSTYLKKWMEWLEENADIRFAEEA